MEDVYKTVNDRTQSLEMHLLDLIATYVAFWDLVPLPAWNGLVEVFLRGWATERTGLTGLKSVPFSHLCLRAWGGNEDFGKTDVTDGPYGVNPDIGEAHDATSFYGNVLRLAIDALHEEQQARCDEQEHASSDAQTAGHKLNRRQKDALESLLPDSAATMTITAYMRLYQVSYGTARADLLGLAEQGLLEQGYAGRALVFRAREKAE